MIVYCFYPILAETRSLERGCCFGFEQNKDSRRVKETQVKKLYPAVAGGMRQRLWSDGIYRSCYAVRHRHFRHLHFVIPNHAGISHSLLFSVGFEYPAVLDWPEKTGAFLYHLRYFYRGCLFVGGVADYRYPAD